MVYMTKVFTFLLMVFFLSPVNAQTPKAPSELMGVKLGQKCDGNKWYSKKKKRYYTYNQDSLEYTCGGYNQKIISIRREKIDFSYYKRELITKYGTPKYLNEDSAEWIWEHDRFEDRETTLKINDKTYLYGETLDESGIELRSNEFFSENYDLYVAEIMGNKKNDLNTLK